jgi:beta-glucosidase
MGAYNKFHGQWCCHNRRLLMDILKGEWGFEGLVVSDWDGCHVSTEAAENGLDIEMGTSAKTYGDYHLARAFREGLEDGRYPMALLDDKVRRILRVIFAVGLMEPGKRQAGKQHPPEHLAVARRIAEEGVVLLKNDGLLPLEAKRLRRIAVIGDNADRRHALGGGSSGVKAFYEVTPLQGLREALGDGVEIVHEPGYPEALQDLPQIPDSHLATVDPGSGIKGWRVEWNNFHGFEGETLAVQFRESVRHAAPADAILVPGLRRNWWATRWTATLTPPADGEYTFALNADHAALLRIDGKTAIGFTQNNDSSVHTAKVALRKGVRYSLEIEYRHTNGDSYLQFGWFPPGESLSPCGEARERALRAIEGADVVIFCGGLNHFHDNEGMDRISYGLPGGQDELIHAISQLHPRVVVLLVGGSAHAMPWADKVSAIVWGGYAGGDAGRVFADILLGKVNPSGKLPFTIARRLEDYPARALDDYRAERARYPEGPLVGYRWFDAKGIEPLFPFGFGKSYTTFEITDAEEGQGEDGGRFLAVTVRNTGKRDGAEVVQLYREHPAPGDFDPPRELRAFRKVNLNAGQCERIAFELPAGTSAASGPAFRYRLGTSSRHLI